MGEMERSLEDVNRLISLSPKHAEAHRFRSQVLSRMGDLERAFQDANTAVELEPDSPACRAQRGEVALQRNNYDLALSDLNVAIAKGDADPNWLVARSTALNQIREHGSAISDCQLALEIDPEHVRAHTNLAWSYAYQGRWREAIQAARRGVEKARHAWETVDLLAWFLTTAPATEMRNGAEALDLIRGIPAESGLPEWQRHQLLAAASADVGRFEEARRLIVRAIDSSPEDSHETLRAMLSAFQENRAFVLEAQPGSMK